MLVSLGLLALAAWRWMRIDPPAGSVEIHPLDPLLVAARTRARASLPEFRELLDAEGGEPLVKLWIDRRGPAYRGLWADPIHHDAAEVRVRVRGSGQEATVAWSEVEDWQVILPDGSIRGAFTVVAAWRIRHRDGGALPHGARRSLGRFVDLPREGEGGAGGPSLR